jgi:hypothetical protein
MPTSERHPGIAIRCFASGFVTRMTLVCGWVIVAATIFGTPNQFGSSSLSPENHSA